MSYRNNLSKLRNFILFLCLLITMLTGCHPVNEQEIETKTLVESATDMPQLAEVTVGDIKNSEYLDGEINPYMQVLQFPKKGSFLEFRVSLGDTVSKGQVIAVTQPAYEEEIEELEESIALMQTEYANTVTNFELQLKTNSWKAGQMREIIENMDSDMEGFDEDRKSVV